MDSLMTTPNWKVGDRVKVNERYAEWRNYIGIIHKDGIDYTPPIVGTEGVILDVDRQGDAWTDFGDKFPDGWPMNQDWADVINIKEDTN